MKRPLLSADTVVHFPNGGGYWIVLNVWPKAEFSAKFYYATVRCDEHGELYGKKTIAGKSIGRNSFELDDDIWSGRAVVCEELTKKLRLTKKLEEI